MHTHLGRFGAPLFAMFLCMAAGSHAAEPDMVAVGRHQVNALRLGAGTYTVIFESGFGSDMSAWRHVAPEVAKSAQVVVYSRAGHGRSAPRTEPRTLAANTAELEQLLATMQLKPPYILVGHSYGGFLIRSFAARHPDWVAGMVFVDPSDERFNAELKKINAARVAQDARDSEAFTPPQFKQELQHVQQLLDSGTLPLAGPLPDVPVAVLTSVMQREHPELFLHTPEAIKVWRARHEAFFRSFANGSHTVTAHSGHNIHLEQPKLVIGAIEQVLASAAEQEKRRLHGAARTALFLQLERAAVLVAAGRDAEAETTAATALASSQFGEAEINRIGYELSGKRKQPRVAELVMKINASTHEQSDNARDSYGEVLLGARKPAEARTQFKRAIELAEARGKSARVVAGYRANLARAEQLLAAPGEAPARP